jgi:diguanylate cyclase (GGDEF)-like protein/PAS domain S-box-containing protein
MRPKPGLNHKTRLAFASAMLTLLVVGAIFYREMVVSRDSARWVSHTHEVLESIHDLLFAVESIGSNSRGFALTGKESYLESYRTGVLKIAQDQAAIRHLTLDNPEQQRQIPLLESLTAQEIQRAETVIRPGRAQGLAAAATQDGPGGGTAEEFLAVVAEMQSEELRLLVLRTAKIKQLSIQTGLLLFFATALGLFITAGAGLSVQRDSSRRALAEGALRESERKYRTLIQEVREYAILMLGPRGEIRSWNPGAERMTGCTREEITGHNFSFFFSPEDVECGRPEEILRLAAASGQYEEQGVRVRKNGSRFLVHSSYTVSQDPNGQLLGFSVVSRDLSESKESEARYRGLLEAAPDAMVVVDQGGEIVLLNVQAEKQFGYRRDELVGQKVKNIIPEGFAERLIADGTRSAAEALAQQIGTGIELNGRRKDGSEFPIEIMLSPLESAEGILVTAAIRNISIRKTAEEHLAQMEGRYRGLLEAAPDAMVVVDQGGEIVLLNVQAEKQFGYRRDELIGQKVKNIIPEGFAERLIADGTRSAAEALAQQIGTGIELNGRRKDGSEFPIEIMLSPLESAEGILVTAAIRDISIRKAAEEHLAQMEGRYRGLLEAAPDAMVVVDQGGEIVLLNVQAEKQFGYRRDELIGQKVKNIIPKGFAERLVADALRSAEDALAQQIGTGIELNGRRKDGSEFPIEIMLSPLEGTEGVLVTAAIRDITTRKKAEALMIHSSEHDFLTGLPNRMLLSDRVNQAIRLAIRHRKKVAVLFLDLDGFKHINDSLGHPTGDKLLQSVGKRLVDCVRGSDTVSRQGGDEFVVLLSEEEDSEDASYTAKRMLRAVAEAHFIDQHDLHVTCSVGVSLYPDDGLNAETLIKNADTAMYQAKENGRQTYKYFKPAMNVRAVERQSLEESLRRALERQEFVVHYQPKIDLKTGRISGAEALLRWTHPTRGPVPPGQFIPVAEDCGLILPIGTWVLRQACQQAQAWVDAGLPLGTMAVNISATQLRNESFLEAVFAILQDTRLDPRLLELELTESVLMKHAESTASILTALRERGVQVAVDDFGTGYSSLSYLRKFPIDALKIDQSFVSQITTVPDEIIIVKAVIGLGRSLKLRVVAEGVETQEQLAFLQAHQCDEAQGYYFSRPVLPEQFAKLLKTGIMKAVSAKR